MLWNYTYSICEGPANNYNYLENPQRVFLGSWTNNPVFYTAYQVLQQNAIAFNQKIATRYSNMFNIIDQAFQNFRQSIQNNSQQRQQIQEKLSDVILDLQTMIDPTSNTEIKMPINNDHFFITTAGEYIGDNSPLFKITDAGYSPYNWIELQKSIDK